MNQRLHNKIEAFLDTGSFWGRNLEESNALPFARALTRLTVGSSFQGQFEESVQWLAGERETLVENLLWTFKENEVLSLDKGLNQRVKTTAVDGDGKTYIAIARPSTPSYEYWTRLYLNQDPGAMEGILAEDGEFILFPISYIVDDATTLSIEDKKVTYAMPIPHGYTPLCIASETGEYTIGISYLARDGFLVFFEPPLELFPERSFVVRSGWKKLVHPHDFVWGVENT